MKIRVEQVEETKKVFIQLSGVADKQAQEGIRNIINVIVPNIQSFTPVWKGHLKADIDGVIDPQGNVVRGIIEARTTDPVIVASVAGGTKPHWPPWGEGSTLAEWAKDKGIPPFLVARAIANHGTIKRFGRPKGGAEMFDKGYAASESRIDQEVDAIGDRVIQGI